MVSSPDCDAKVVGLIPTPGNSLRDCDFFMFGVWVYLCPCLSMFVNNKHRGISFPAAGVVKVGRVVSDFD